MVGKGLTEMVTSELRFKRSEEEKRQFTEWKIIPQITNKSLIPRIYKELL